MGSHRILMESCLPKGDIHPIANTTNDKYQMLLLQEQEKGKDVMSLQSNTVLKILIIGIKQEKEKHKFSLKSKTISICK